MEPSGSLWEEPSDDEAFCIVLSKLASLHTREVQALRQQVLELQSSLKRILAGVIRPKGDEPDMVVSRAVAAELAALNLDRGTSGDAEGAPSNVLIKVEPREVSAGPVAAGDQLHLREPRKNSSSRGPALRRSLAVSGPQPQLLAKELEDFNVECTDKPEGPERANRVSKGSSSSTRSFPQDRHTVNKNGKYKSDSQEALRSLGSRSDAVKEQTEEQQRSSRRNGRLSIVADMTDVEKEAVRIAKEAEQYTSPAVQRHKRLSRMLGQQRTFHVFRRWTLPWIVDHPAFDSLCAVMIIVNSVLIGINIDWLTDHYNEENFILTVASFVCNTFFLLELLLRMRLYGCRKFFLGENRNWNMFDFLLVIFSAVDLVMTRAARDGEAAAIGSGMKTIKMLRIIRVFRVFRFFRELSLLALMIVDSMKSLMWALIMLTIIIYVFAIWFTQSASDYIHKNLAEAEALTGSAARNIPELQRQFGSLMRTVYTLVQAMLGGVSWGVVSDVLLTIDLQTTLLFFFYIAFTILAVLNIITGVFVDNAVETAKTQREFLVQKEMELKEKYVGEMRDLFNEMDKDGDGNVNFEKFRTFFEDKRVASYFQALGLDPRDTDRLFCLIDDDDSGTISIEEFLDGCLRLKGQARSIDVHNVIHDMRRLFLKVDRLESVFHKERCLQKRPPAQPRREGHASVLTASTTTIA